ncbi:MAG TPA: ABC transporter permease subunit, partial [Candidatus Saccharimonas sp.]|nr:ABC transporter permease subunit [Candidatus Saccharimonas sp.]
MWPVFWYEFKHKRLGLAAYCGAILGFTVLYVMIYPSVLASMDKFQEIFKAYPKELFQAFNIPSLTFDTVEKYLGAESFSFVWPIMGIALVLARAGNGLAGEIERRTIGLLLSMPVSRGRIYLAKYLVGPVSILAFTLLSTVVVVPLAPLAGVQADAGIMLRALAS